MVSLREWETARPDQCSLLAQQSLADFPAGRRLAEELSRTGRIEVLELARGLELRATSFVGRISLGEVTVTIQPKITGGPLLSLFRYAYGLRNLDLYGATDFASSSWSFQDLLIHQLAAEASELLNLGIHRDYERIRGDLASPRGRIDSRGTPRPFTARSRRYLARITRVRKTRCSIGCYSRAFVSPQPSRPMANSKGTYGSWARGLGNWSANCGLTLL
jgi:hypothetical protein